MFVLEWLTSGAEMIRREFEHKFSKTCGHEDIKHILSAICDGLKDEIRWPNAAERRALCATQGVFNRVIGYTDGCEQFYKRTGDDAENRRNASGKKKRCTKSTLAAVDRNGYFIYVKCGHDGSLNDRQQFTMSALYTNCGEYFTGDEVLAGDGAFAGDGPILTSFSILDTREKQMFNATFTEGRLGIENAFGRVQAFFPLLGRNKKYWPYDEETLQLAINASCLLHNFLLRSRHVMYNQAANPSARYAEYM